MNILIADSGSTKTDWCLIRETMAGEIIQTPGLNPYFLDQKAIHDILDKELAPYIYFDKVDQIHFYGAGLGNPANRERLDDVLGETFGRADITIETDMLGAARGLYGREQGIAAILGTGSNSCYYSNGVIAEQYPSLGYILGDDGSGTHLGKQFYRALLTGMLPEELTKLFAQKYHTDRAHIFDKIYHQKQANVTLASCVPFIIENKQHPFLQSMIMAVFDDFFRMHPAVNTGNNQYEWRLTGSVAYLLRDELSATAATFNVRINKIMKSPIEGLIKYHTPEV